MDAFKKFVITRIALKALDRLEDKQEGGFFDRFCLRGGLLELEKKKKAFYNAACLIALLDRWPKKRLQKHVDYLVKRCEENDFLVPSFEGRPEATWGEQGLLLWALSKADEKGFKQAREACEGLHEKIVSNAGEKGLPRAVGSQWFAPMDNAFVLDGLIECGDFETARLFSGALLDACKPPVFLIECGGKKANRVSFNNLVYPVHALSRYCLKTRKPKDKNKTRKKLLRAVEGLLGLQGTQGQWWWTYDSEGRVVQRYPVYSVHQDGMAVMALKQASRVFPRLKPRVQDALVKSFAWLYGNNEVRQSLLDARKGVVWRSVRCPFVVQKINQFLPWFPEFGLRVKKESRSYHYAWLLYGASL